MAAEVVVKGCGDGGTTPALLPSDLKRCHTVNTTTANSTSATKLHDKGRWELKNSIGTKEAATPHRKASGEAKANFFAPCTARPSIAFGLYVCLQEKGEELTAESHRRTQNRFWNLFMQRVNVTS